MKEELTRFTIYPPKALLDRLKEIAKDHHRSVNSEIVMLIEEHVEREEKKGKHGKKDV
jgi:hypothetical protein